MSNFLIFKAAFNNSATPAIGTYTAEGATAQFNKDTNINPDYYLYNTAGGTAVQWFTPTAETTDFEFAADILTRYWNNRVTYFIIADSTGTTRLRMWSQYDNWEFENSDSIDGSGSPEYIGTVNPTTSGGFGVFHQFRVRVRKLTASSSSVEVYVDGTLKLTAIAGAALVTCAKIGFVGGVNTFGPGTDAGVKNAYVYDLSGGEVIDRGVLSGAFNRFTSWMKSKFALKSDIPTVNDATLTIQRNGTTIDTFTANASVDKTININTADDTKIPLAGSNQISGDLIPSTDGTVNLGGSSYQWNNAYIKSLTINGVACGDILTHNVSEFVDVSSDQTIGGTKTFGSLVSKSGTLERGTLPTNMIKDDPIFISVDKNNRRTLVVYNYYFINGNGRVVLYAYNQNTTDYDNIGVTFDFNNVSNNKSVNPSTTETYNLGTPTNKWKSFNGINPGALSLPGTFVNVDTTNWDAAGGTNVYTPPANGWLHIIVAGATELMVRWTGWGFGDRRVSATATDLGVTIPVVAGVTVDIVTVASGFDGKCQFFPCQGNV